MRILYVGDVMAEMGMVTLQQMLTELREPERIDAVVVQAENVSDGKGLSINDYDRLRGLGVDGFTGGNHTTAQRELFDLLRNPSAPVTGPANMHDCPGPGYKYIDSPRGRLLIISMLGKIVGRDSEKPLDNPLQKIDEILKSQEGVERSATLVNFHGDFSSEKVVFGHYLDGRVSAVIGDHWHVPTADARILPGGTGYQSDVGMCGSLESSLGVTFDSIIPRWRDGQHSKNQLETKGARQFNGTIITVDETTHLATDIQAVRRIFAD